MMRDGWSKSSVILSTLLFGVLVGTGCPEDSEAPDVETDGGSVDAAADAVEDGGEDAGDVAEDDASDASDVRADDGGAETDGGPEEDGSSTDGGTSDATDADPQEDVGGGDADADTGGDELGPNSGSLSFDGEDDILKIPSDAALRDYDDLTIEAWVKPEDVSNSPRLVSKDDSFYIEVNDADDPPRAKISVSGSGDVLSEKGCTTWGTGVPLDEWTHVALVYDDGSGAPALYIDGQLIDESSCALETKNRFLKPIFVGAGVDGTTNQNYWTGSIDEVRIWDAARDASQLQAHMDEKLTGDESGLIGYWPFDQAAGQRAIDRSPNSNDGQLGTSDSPELSDPIWSGETPF